MSSPVSTIIEAERTPSPSSEVIDKQATIKKGSAFWLSFVALTASTFLSAIDLTAVSTALPTIADDLHGGNDFTWVGTAYALTSTAILPLSGGLADIFGRKPVMLISIAFFALGSALSGASQSMAMLIGARAVQGIGGGGIINLVEIIVSDLVPLSERGTYQGVIGLTWAFASAIGPPIGGSLAQKASWRWLFYINLPLTGLSFALVVFFLRVRTPHGSIKAKLARIDWIGNLIIMAGSTLAVISLTWGGITYPWDSARVLAMLIIGLVLIGAFFLYEAKIPKEPTIPWSVVSNRTSLGGYIATFIHSVVSIAIIYYLPVYFQACQGAGPIRSGIEMFPTALIIAPFAIVAGAAVVTSNKYRPVNLAGWLCTVTGFGLLTLLRATSSTANWVGFQILVSVGIGLLYTATVFPVLAPLPIERTASALAFFAFCRAFAQTWGITVSGTILQNELKKKLPAAFVAQFPQGSEIVYAAIPHIGTLPEPLRSEVRLAFAASINTIWKTMTGIAGIGLLSVLLLREIPMQQSTDQNFGLHDDRGGQVPDEEKAAPQAATVVVEE